MTAWTIRLTAAVVLGIAEAFTLTAALGLLGGAALIAAGSATIGLPVAAQLLVFAVTAGVGIVALRPVAARAMSRSRLERSGVDALIGRPTS